MVLKFLSLVSLYVSELLNTNPSKYDESGFLTLEANQLLSLLELRDYICYFIILVISLVVQGLKLPVFSTDGSFYFASCCTTSSHMIPAIAIPISINRMPFSSYLANSYSSFKSQLRCIQRNRMLSTTPSPDYHPISQLTPHLNPELSYVFP